MKFYNLYIPALLLLATVGIAPWFSIEPINTIKFFFLVLAAFISLGYIATNLSVIRKFHRKEQAILLLMSFFIFSNLVVFVVSDIGWRQQLFGYLGRNTGLIFQLSLAIIFVFLFSFSNLRLELTIVKTLSFCGAISLLYGVIQYLKIDPINWNNPYSPIIGFLGNPNFQSSFLGMYSIFLVKSIMDYPALTSKWNFSLITLISSVFIIMVSDSIQGIFVMASGVAILILGKLRSLKMNGITTLYSMLLLSGIFLSIIGLLQKGPLKFLYQPSVSFRGDYWRAGWKMFQDHLTLGLGHSSFGDYYMSYRDQISLSGIEGRGADTFSNSPHNVVVDIASTGGLILLIPYICLIIISFYYIFKVRASIQPSNNNFYLFAAFWFAFIVQAMISVQFIVLSFWGWVFLALYLKNAMYLDHKLALNSSTSDVLLPLESKIRTEPRRLAVTFLGIIGLIVGFLPLRAGIAQKNAYESGQLDKIIASAYVEPLDADRMNQIALLIAKNRQIPQALNILQLASTITPRNHDTWNLISKLTAPNSPEAKKAQRTYESLNPYYDFKIESQNN